MPFYNTASTAAALDVSQKWVDNLLSHNKLAGVQQARQGVPRRVSIEAIVVMAVAKQLNEAMGLSIPAALSLAEQLTVAPHGRLMLAPAIELSVDLETLSKELRDQLAHVVEVTPHPQRGRPKQPAASESDPPETQRGRLT